MTHETRQTLTVPAVCEYGHALVARTTHVLSYAGDPAGWRCVRCTRIAVYRAHYGADAQIPSELLAETNYDRQARIGSNAGQRFATRVHFESGWGFQEDDPTPELRHELREQDRLDRERLAAERQRSAKRASNAEALEVLSRLRGAA